jgi:amino acid transporter
MTTNSLFFNVKKGVFDAEKFEWIRLASQVGLVTLVVGYYFSQHHFPTILLIRIWVVIVFAILLSTLIVRKVKLSGIINSVTINLVVGFLFFIVEIYFKSSFDSNGKNQKHYMMQPCLGIQGKRL